MSIQECLLCAEQNRIPPCGFDYALLKYIYSQNRYREKEIHVSDLLQCARKSYFSKVFDLPIRADQQLIVSFGKIQHEFLEKSLADDSLLETEQILEGDGLVGTADIVYREGRIIDFKTTRNIDLRYIPKKEHVLQVNIYAELLRESKKVEIFDAAIQYIDFLGPSKCPTCKAFVSFNGEKLVCPLCNAHDPLFHRGAVLVSVPLFEREKIQKIIAKKTKVLQKAIKQNKPPEAEPSFLCRYCPFLNKCPSGSAEVFGRF